MADFTTSKATLSGVEVNVTGRLVVSGQATVIDATLPANAAARAVAGRASELLVAALAAATPTGSATRIEVSLGGNPLVLELTAAPVGPAFQVTGHFTAKAGTLSVPGVDVISPQITLDATIWIAPPLTTGASPSQPAAAAPGDATVKTYSFAGDLSRFSDTAMGGRSRSVSLKSSFDELDQRLKPEVKAGARGFLTRREQVLAFFQEMRSYFGTDDKTIDHFANFRKANIKGATTILHEAAALRLEAVQAEVGTANMPSSGGVGWPRSECRLSGKAGLDNLHNLGMAIDYNAAQAPNIKDLRIKDLIKITTGRGPTANYPSTRGIDRRKVDETSTTGSDAEKQALANDAAVTRWLDGVEAEATALGQASEDFRASLQTKADPSDPKSAVVDNGPKLVALRTRWHAAAAKPPAQRTAERAAVMAELPAVVTPWRDKIVASRTTSQADITNSGVDAATLPTDSKAVADAALTAERLRQRAQPLLAAAAPLPKTRRRQIDVLIRQARTAIGEQGGSPSADDAATIAELKRLDKLLEKRGIALLAHSRIMRMNSLEAALSDANFMFGSDPSAAVINPSAAQLVGEGFFTLKGAPRAGVGAFSPAFVRSMLKHGFGHGAEWGSPDLMHFELRWKGPGQ
ncbi:MAG: hypothetical protein ACRDRA_02540 [Pseudonocardiaceae bacterium]